MSKPWSSPRHWTMFRNQNQNQSRFMSKNWSSPSHWTMFRNQNQSQSRFMSKTNGEA